MTEKKSGASINSESLSECCGDSVQSLLDGGSVQSLPDKGSVQSPLDGGIERLVAKGHVEITKEGWVATGNQAEYFSKERKVVLTGDTKVWQNNNLVTGDTFTMYLDEGKSIVERNSKKGERVKAFFYPDAEKH